MGSERGHGFWSTYLFSAVRFKLECSLDIMLDAALPHALVHLTMRQFELSFYVGDAPDPLHGGKPSLLSSSGSSQAFVPREC